MSLQEEFQTQALNNILSVLQDIRSELRDLNDLQRAQLAYAWRIYDASLAVLPQDRAENLAAAHQQGIWLTSPPFAVADAETAEEE